MWIDVWNFANKFAPTVRGFTRNYDYEKLYGFIHNDDHETLRGFVRDCRSEFIRDQGDGMIRRMMS